MEISPGLDWSSDGLSRLAMECETKARLAVVAEEAERRTGSGCRAVDR